MLYRSFAALFVAAVATGAVAVPVASGSDSSVATLVSHKDWGQCWDEGFDKGYWEAIGSNCPGHHGKREEVSSLSARAAAAYAVQPSVDRRDVCDDARAGAYNVGWNAGFNKCFQ